MKKKIILTIFLMTLMIFGSYTIILAQGKDILKNDSEIEIQKYMSNKTDIEGLENSTTVSVNEKTEYKSFNATGTYYEAEQGGPTILIKVNLEWLKNPQKRYDDIVVITYSNHLLIKDEHIEDAYYYLVRCVVSYNEKGKDNKLTPKSVVYDGTNADMYRVLSGGIAFKLPLPDKKNVSNIKVSCSCVFVPYYKEFYGDNFGVSYTHQINRGYLLWKNLEVYEEPFFKYHNSLWLDDPTYDRTLYGILGVFK